MHEAVHKQPNLRSQPALLAGMGLALLLFYQGGALAPALLGLAAFGGLALLRPDLALLFVPLTVPLYLIPGSLPGLRARGFDLPLHEAALLLAFAATLARWGWARKEPSAAGSQQPAGDSATAARLLPTDHRPTRFVAAISAGLRAYAPHLLFLLAGLLGVALAVQRGPALIEFRRLVAEPLLFYALARWHGRSAMPRLVAALVLAGALVAALGLLQYLGLDLVPWLGAKQCFAPDGGPCANVVVDRGLRRVQSVYGHPNNLGLFLGRAWPLAAGLALAALSASSKRSTSHDERQTTKDKPIAPLRLSSFALDPGREARSRNGAWLWALASFLCLAGIVVSFSRGAWLGALAAALVLALGMANDRRPGTKEQIGSFVLRPSSRWLLALGVTLALLAGLALTLRGDLRGGSTPVRLLLWREALGYIRLHPLGIGLDQFGVYHDPQSPLTLIDPALIGTSEQYAAHPHNLLLDTWLRLGPLGMLAFGWLLARLVRAAWAGRGEPLLLGALAATAATLTHGLVDNFYFVSDLAIVFWLLVALAEHAQPPGAERSTP